ncbi:MAG TPA: methylmalonyl-CoA epimerase [Thermoplasmata archaeon]|nr:methylmalonyl-CoA epimerase [Thermoplasmata archaeon]
MKLDHVGIAVPNLATAIDQWRPLVGPPDAAPEEVPSNRVRVAFVSVGDTHIELLEPLDPSSPVARFLEGRGPGVHHLAFHVPSVAASLAQVRATGGRLVDEQPRPGARGRRVGFAHPSAFGGVLVEFVEGP